MKTHLPAILPIAVALLVASAAARSHADSAVVADEIRHAALNPNGSVRVDGFRLKAGPARVTLENGTLVPSSPVAGRPVEFVFLGRGRIELEPPDEIEAGQLELFTGSASLNETFERAVFVVALDAAADTLARKTRATDSSAIGKATEIFTTWIASPERRLLDVEARVFADAVGDRLSAGYFCGYFEGLDLGRFLYVVDPLGPEQVTLGRFVQLDLSRAEERKARRMISKGQRRGKLVGIEVDDLGIWDTWLSTTLTGPDGSATPGTRGVEPDHYELDVSLHGMRLELEATARLSLRILVDGLRCVALQMNPDIRPTSVVDETGRELEWFHSAGEVVAVLGEPVEAGDRVEIEVGFGGFPMEKVASGAWVLRSTMGWYPHAGTVDRATYDVTFHWPGDLDLVAPGAVVDDGREGADRRWRRWRVDETTMGFSFEVGRYETATGRVGEVSVEVAVDRIGHEADDGLADEILATVADVMEYYTEVFGPYPLERLQVVSAPRGFSQGLLGFVTLSTKSVVDWEVWGSLLGLEDRRTVIAHEVAHQWWGNVVGWKSYRDMWISEAMANYSALLYARSRLTDDRDARTLRGPTAGWDGKLIRTHVGGRRLESLGPLVLGIRLRSSISDGAYSAIVYNKGALVLNMLSRYFREEGFLKILREIVSAASFRVISTDDFLLMIQKLGGTDLTWFRQQYVEGTGLPVVRFSYRFEQIENGRWVVVGEARQLPLRDDRFSVVESSGGVLDVHRSAVTRLDPAGAVVVVPFQVGVTDTTDEGASRRRIFSGQLLVSGETSPFRLELGMEPEIFWIDRDSEVFGRFYNDLRWPRLNGLYRGRELAAAGDVDAALASLRAALSAPISVIPEKWRDGIRPFDPDEEARSIDAHIRLEMARIYLDVERVADAARELALADDLIRGSDRWELAADVLAAESRIDLLSGNAKPAFRRLKKRIFGSRGLNSSETWALLAVAAHAVGESEVFDRAASRAEDFGVDLGPLKKSEPGEL
jgi:hypothetical protein